MQRILIFLVLIAAGVGIWFLATNDDPVDPGDVPSQTPTPEDGPRNPSDDETRLERATSPVGPDAEAELLALERPARVLFIGKHQGSWPMLVIGALQQFRDLDYRTWFTSDIKTQQPVAGDGRGMAALTDTPTGAYLDDQDVDALFLDVVDPNAFPKSFWDVVKNRVSSGRMGLYMRPAYLVGEGGVALSQHPALSHPTLSGLLPIASGASIEGSPLPGVFPKGVSLAITASGKKHPATRLVENDIASGNLWQAATSGEGALSTKFCYPVIDLAPGAQVLVEAEAATTLPAIVATPDGEGRPRVLWMGNADFGQRAYFVRGKDEFQKLLVNHWIVWLVGQAVSR